MSGQAGLWKALAGAALALGLSPVLAEDPRAAARALGVAGQATARALARDPAQAPTVPGYAGTDLPERALDADTMDEAARRVLADPGAPGGAAARVVRDGATMRPAAPVDSNEPAVRRARAVVERPADPAFGAGDLASGTTTPCEAALAEAGDGGACGAVTYCVGAGCETVDAHANVGFPDAATRLNMVTSLGGEGFDRDALAFFAGERRACRIRFGGLANCCRNSGLLVGLAGCTEAERALAEERHAGNTHYLGARCTRRVFGVCLRRERAWCVFGSKLGRILHEQARPQLGLDWSSCRGLTVAELEAIDFAALDLAEFTEDLLADDRAPGVALPDSDETARWMRERIDAFYRRGSE